MSAFLLWTTKAGIPGQWGPADATLSETHRFSASVSENPVEAGADVADNVRPELDTVDLSLFVTNAPVTIDSVTEKRERLGAFQGFARLEIPYYEPPLQPTPGSLTTAAVNAVSNLFKSKVEGAQILQFPVYFDSVSQSLQALRNLRDTAQIVELITERWSYTSMVITSVEMPVTAEDGDGATINISLRQIRVVESRRTTEAVPTEVRGKAKKNAGKKGAKPETQGPGSTIAKGLSDGAGFTSPGSGVLP